MSELERSREATISRPGARHLPQELTLLLGALAFSGLAELFLQRVVYRVGVHIPRQGAFLGLYEAATAAGDFAFRLTAVLLAAAALTFALWLMRGGTAPALGAVLVLLLAANFLAWPLGLGDAEVVAAAFFLAGLAACLAVVAKRRGGAALQAAVAGAALALLLGQYRVLTAQLGVADGGVATAQLASEAALLLAAAFLFLAAAGAHRRSAALAAAVVGLLAAAAYAREPATAAILSLWAVGVTLSLPPVLYLLGLVAAVYAAAAWLPAGERRHLGLGVLLLLVAGVQPEVLHHQLTALLGLTLLSLGAAEAVPRRSSNEALTLGAGQASLASGAS